MGNSPHTTSIHILDDDSLLNIFHLYRPFLLGEDEDDGARIVGGMQPWVGERWWYKLAHVCQRWRNLIFGSAAYLGLSLVCTKGTPVAEMLAHSPSLPLVIDHFEGYCGITAEDEKGTILALKQRDRVRRVRLDMPVSDVQKFIVTIEEEYPILEYLIVWNRMEERTVLIFPETLQAPHLCHLALVGFDLPIGSRLLTSPVGLVTLCLVMNDPSTYLHPNTLLQWLSVMPKLETLVISFLYPPSSNDKGQLRHTPVMTPVTLPNLHYFMFRGDTMYLEALVHRITPCPEKVEIRISDQDMYSTPRLLQFMIATENIKFETVKFKFSMYQVFMAVYPHVEAETCALSITVGCMGYYQHLFSMTQFSDSLNPIFSAVEHLILEHEADCWLSEGLIPYEFDRHWHKLLSFFSNVKTLRIDDGLVLGVSRCLKLHGGKLPLELLPELQELTYSGSSQIGDAFTPFINARQSAGRPITLTRR